MRPWLELLRISNLPTVWSNLIAGAVIVSAFDGRVGLGPMLVILVAGSALYLGGMVLNDVFDATIDARERPSRPIPSGRVSRRAASRLGWGLLGVGCLLPWTVSIAAGVIANLIAALVVIYDAIHARTAWSVLVMAGCRAGLYPLAATAVVSQTDPAAAGIVRISEGPLIAGLCGLPVFIHVASFSLVARFEVPPLEESCPRCGQIVLPDMRVCPECAGRCDLEARTARAEARLEIRRGWWGTGTMVLLLPFLGCCGLIGLIATVEGTGPEGRALPVLGTTIAAAIVLGAYLMESTRHLARHPKAVGRFVLRSIATMSLYDAAIVAVTLPEAIGSITGTREVSVAGLVACLACFVLVRWSHRRIPGT